MSYIEPNTNITLYKNTGLSMNYENSLYFADEKSKTLFWGDVNPHAVRTFNKCYYQRSTKNTIRLECPISELYKCDYMRFKNYNYENKFYYAFVVAVNYVNNETTEIVYALDPIMTWMGEFTLKQCLVLREHAKRDRIGDSLTDEGVQLGDYIIDNVFSVPEGLGYNEYKIAVSVADENNTGAIYGGVYSGSYLKFFDDADSASAYLNELIADNKGDNVVGISMVPAYLAQRSDGKYTYVAQLDKGNNDFDGYVPRNNKLFTYPYHKIVAANNAGAEQTYRPEFFTLTDDKLVFHVYATLGQTCDMILIPVKYKGTGENLEEILTMPSFPLCSWSYDSYKAWLAQYNAYYPQQADLLENQLQMRTAKTAVNGLASIAMGGFTGGVGQYSNEYNYSGRNWMSVGTDPILGAGVAAVGAGVNQIVNAVNNKLDREALSRDAMIYNSVVPNTPQVLKGKVTPNALFALGAMMGFRIYDKKITAQYARIIDDYFTMYGYTLNQVKEPSMNNRKYYTYVKTSGCVVGGELPTDDANSIERLFDSGIRLWKNLDDIGNYDLVNEPLET